MSRPKLSSLTMIYPHEYLVHFWLSLSSRPWQLPIAVNAEACLHIMRKGVFFSQLGVLSTLNFDWMPPWVHVIKQIRNFSVASVPWIMRYFICCSNISFFYLSSEMLPHSISHDSPATLVHEAFLFNSHIGDKSISLWHWATVDAWGRVLGEENM